MPWRPPARSHLGLMPTPPSPALNALPLPPSLPLRLHLYTSQVKGINKYCRPHALRRAHKQTDVYSLYIVPSLSSSSISLSFSPSLPHLRLVGLHFSVLCISLSTPTPTTPSPLFSPPMSLIFLVASFLLCLTDSLFPSIPFYSLYNSPYSMCVCVCVIE